MAFQEATTHLKFPLVHLSASLRARERLFKLSSVSKLELIVPKFQSVGNGGEHVVRVEASQLALKLAEVGLNFRDSNSSLFHLRRTHRALSLLEAEMHILFTCVDKPSSDSSNSRRARASSEGSI